MSLDTNKVSYLSNMLNQVFYPLILRWSWLIYFHLIIWYHSKRTWNHLVSNTLWDQALSNVSMLNLDMLTLQHIVFIVFYIFLIKHIKSYIVYIHIGRMLKPLSLPWSHSLITRYVVSPFQVKSQKFLLHLLTILRRFCAIRVLYITVIIIVMTYKVIQL